MFSFRNDPGADGVGVAFFDAVAPDGGRLDLSLLWPDAWRAPDWDRAEAELGVPVLNVHQVHGDRVVVVDAGTDPRALAAEEADALVTTARGIALAVRAADCLPVLFADTAGGVVGAAHAGRVGLGAGVLPATVAAMSRLGASTIAVWIGPHICGDCYEVPATLRDEFGALHPAAVAATSWGTPSLDLGAAARAQLEALDCTVVRVDPCTRTTPTLHSFRRDAAASGRQAGVVWLL
ncbi:MAG: polyphenol oxidase family protein [Propionicimonas sp.]|uniref:polyphenol oxidase family protein n=1 Tax=Propionicimonas sp. TaxID=1955623 RepID=UPI003D1446BA